MMNALMATLISFLRVHVLRYWLQKYTTNHTLRQNMLLSLAV